MTQEAPTPPVEDDRPFAEFAAFVKQLKDERGLKQSDIARAVDVAPSQPSGWASGRSRPRPETLERLAEVYGLNVDELFRLCRYRSRVERTVDPDETELLAIYRQVPDEHRSTIKHMLRGLRQRRGYHVEHDVTDDPDSLDRSNRSSRLPNQPIPSVRRRYESQSVASQIARYGFEPATV